MEWIWEILVAAGSVFVKMAPYLVLGFFLAGWLYVLIPRATVADKLGHQQRLGPLWAALVGIPLPLCSCGVLPFARLLKDRKASPGSIVSFLLTTPQTGADSIAVSASILGWPLTLWKVGTAFVSGVIGGFTANSWASISTQQDSGNAEGCCSAKKPEPAKSPCCTVKPPKTESPKTSCRGATEGAPKAPTSSCCDSGSDKPEEPTRAVASCCASKDRAPAQPPPSSCGCGKPDTNEANPTEVKPPSKMRAALYYGFFQNLGDVAVWLVWGILGAGVIAYAVPPDFFGTTIQSSWVEMLVILGVSIPLYVCATGSIPIAAALAAKGLSAGAVMVFLIAGPAMSAVSLAVLGKTLGRRLLFVYIATIVCLSAASGLAFNAWFPNLAQSIQPAHACAEFAWWEWTATVILGSALALHFIQRFVRKLGKAWLRICPECLTFCLKGCDCCGCAQ